MLSRASFNLLRSTSNQRQDAIDLNTLRASLANLDLNDRTETARAHRILTEMPELQRVGAEASNGMDPARVHEACAALFLYGLEDERNESALTGEQNPRNVPPRGTTAIEQSRDAAREAVREFLSPVGQAALLQSVGPDAQDDGLFQCLPVADRLRLAGDVHRQRAERLRDFRPDEPTQLSDHLRERADACEQAVALYDAATYAYAQVGQLAQVAATFAAIAEIFRQVGELELAGDAARRAGENYLRAGLGKEAGAAFAEAGLFYEQADRLPASVKAFEDSAAARQQPQVNQPDEAGQSLEHASRLYSRLGKLLQAANTCVQAVERYMQGASGAAKAAPLLGQAGAWYGAAGEPPLAAITLEKAANACLLTNLHDAADYYERAATEWLAAPGCEALAEIALGQALLCFRADAQNQSAAGEQALAASQAAVDAGDPTQAAQHRQNASLRLAGAARSLERAGNIHRTNAHPALAEDDFRTAITYFTTAADNAREAGEHARTLGNEDSAFTLFGLAGDALMHVVNISRATEQPVQAATAFKTATEDFTSAGDSAFAMGDSLAAGGQHARARAWYERAEVAYNQADEPELAAAAAEAAAALASRL